MAKRFKLSRDEIVELIADRGGCIASDRITVDGRPVGFMYRERAEDPRDSGWRFLAGDESDDDMADTKKHGVYAVNTIANYDRSIIPLLDAPVGSAFERQEEGGALVAVVD